MRTELRQTQAATTGFRLGELPEDPPRGWRVDSGDYRLHIGRSSADIAHVVTVSR